MAEREPSQPTHADHYPPSDFHTTHWSLVLEAGQPGHPAGHTALEELCRRYWYPLYAFVRKRGRSHEDAQDAVQSFLARLLARNDLASVHPDKGRFRTFLLTSLANYLANEWHRTNAQKRGGGIPLESLEALAAEGEERFGLEPAVEIPPEQMFDRAWAEQMLSAVLARLRAENTSGDDAQRFEALQECLLGESTQVPYAELAERLGLSEAGIKSAVHRLRRRFREIFREEIGRTVSRREDIDQELKHLVAVMLD